jgi:hypothetical protein
MNSHSFFGRSPLIICSRISCQEKTFPSRVRKKRKKIEHASSERQLAERDYPAYTQLMEDIRFRVNGRAPPVISIPALAGFHDDSGSYFC